MTPSSVIWLDGEFVPWDEAKVHVLSHALHYGSGVFEGIRAYATDRGPAVFRLPEHMARLVRGCAAYGLPLDRTADELAEVACAVIRENDLPEGYIRPLVFLGLGSIGLNPAGATTHVMVAAWEWGTYLGEEGVRNGIRARVASWRRIDHGSLIPSAKGTGGYLNSILAKTEAVKAGYDEAILLNTQGFVAEGSGENVFVITDGVVRTPPTADGCLNGITRDTAITLLRSDDVEIREESLTRASLYGADEAFLVGTAAEVTPLRELDDRPIGSGEPGPITRMVQEAYADLVRGRIAEYDHWLTYVKDA